MDSIILHIWIISDDENMASELAKSRPVKDVTYDFHTVNNVGDVPSLERTFDNIVITDKINELLPFFNQRGVSLIYIGTAAELLTKTKIPPNNLLEIWAPDVPLFYRSSRFYHAASDHLVKYHEWLYHNWLMATIDSMQDLVWYKDKEGLHWMMNSRFEETVHKTRAQMHGKDHNYIWDVPPEEGNDAAFRCLESELEVMKRKETVVADELVKNNKGLRHFLTYKSPLYGRDGQVIGTVGIGHDVTDMNNTSLELKILLDNLPLPVLVCDENWKPAQVNRHFIDTFAINDDPDAIAEFDYQGWRQYSFKETVPREYDEASHTYRFELSMHVGEEERIFTVVEQEIRDYFENVTGYYCLYEDITERREYEQMILRFANTDPLTGLHNRRYFFNYMAEHKTQPLTVLFLDMDNFKKVNDKYGHSSGDNVLSGTSERIKKTFPNDTVARLGGDEFAVAILGNPDEDELKETIASLTAGIENEYKSLDVGLSVSVGIAHSDDTIDDIDEFMNQSDEQMYENKIARKRARGAA